MAKERIVLQIEIDFISQYLYQMPVKEDWEEVLFDLPREYLPKKAKHGAIRIKREKD